jgi:hypothetical protein
MRIESLFAFSSSGGTDRSTLERRDHQRDAARAAMF